MSDFDRAHQAADSFDNKLLSAGVAISSGYADLLALTTRQIFGSLDITLALGSDGNWNFSDAMVFMKNMGAAGSNSPYVLLPCCLIMPQIDYQRTVFPVNGKMRLIQLTRSSQRFRPFFI